MKSLIIFIALILFSGSSDKNLYNLTIQVNGFSNNDGRAFIGLYREQDKWPEIKKQYIGKVVSIENRIAKISFEKLEKGTYAAAVFHDKNKNGVLDKNLVGMPTEAYGFSNNARETFSAPSFKNASVTVDRSKTISITVK